MKINSYTLKFDIDSKMDQGAGFSADQVSLERPQREALELNLVAIWFAPEEKPVLLVTIDALYPGSSLRAAIEAAAKELDPDRILVAASHSHQSPMLDDSKPLLGIPNDIFVSELNQKIAEIVPFVLDETRAEEVTMRVGRNTAAHSINRRRRAAIALESTRLRRNRVLLAPNPSGVVDETIIVAAFYGTGGEPILWLWNYACHPVAHPESTKYSSHYPHVVRERLRKHTGDISTPVLFFQGFSGNTRPNASVGVKGWKEVIRFILSGPRFRNMKPKEYAIWSESLADLVVETSLHPTLSEENLPRTRRLTRDGSKFAVGLERDVTFQMVRLSKDFLIASVSGEVVAEYAPFVRGLSDTSYVMCVGCTDDTFGYIPTQEMLNDGGYEADGYCSQFNVDRVNPAIEDECRDGFTELLLQESPRLKQSR